MRSGVAWGEFRAADVHSGTHRNHLQFDIDQPQMLDGARGAEPVDRRMLAGLLLRVAGFAAAHPDIAEIDLNPVIAAGSVYSIVDARMILADRPRA